MTNKLNIVLMAALAVGGGAWVFAQTKPTASTFTERWKSGATVVTRNGDTLTVSGKGAMADYCFECETPWERFRTTTTNLVIDAGVTAIGKTAFMGFIGLTSVTIPNSVKVIRDDAFGSCTTLTSVNMPNSVNTIGWGAFAGCTNLPSITIPSGVVNINEKAFFQSDSLASINVAADNPKYSSEDGVLFNKNKTALIVYPQNKKGAYTIPESVTKLGEIAFKRCDGLTSLTCLNPVPPIIGAETFFVSPNICLYVPENSVTAYRTAEQWKYDFKCINGIESAPQDVKGGNNDK